MDRPRFPLHLSPSLPETIPIQSPNPNNPPSNWNDGSAGVFPKNYVVPGSVMPRYELSVLCEKMDGVGLRNYIHHRFKQRVRLEAELPGALRCAPAPAEMVLESLKGFHDNDDDDLKDSELRKMRKCCIILLKQFRVADLSVRVKAREKALKLAVEWKGRLMVDKGNKLVALGFLYFVAAFGLVSKFSNDELVDILVITADNHEWLDLCRVFGLLDRVPDIIQKLLDRGKHILAVKYVFELNLADKFPPVPILKDYVDESKKLSERLSQEGKPSVEIRAREIHALKSLIKIIENHKLESEYPRVSLDQHIKQLNRPKVNMKHTANPTPHQQQKRNTQKQKQQQCGIKHPRTSASVDPAAVPKNVNYSNSTIHQYQQPFVHPSGLFPDHPNPYMSSSVMPFGMVASTPTISPFTSPSAGPYGLAGLPMGPSGNRRLGASHLNSSESHVPFGYYDRDSSYDDISLSHYYQASYYPQ